MTFIEIITLKNLSFTKCNHTNQKIIFNVNKYVAYTWPTWEIRDIWREKKIGVFKSIKILWLLLDLRQEGSCLKRVLVIVILHLLTKVSQGESVKVEDYYSNKFSYDTPLLNFWINSWYYLLKNAKYCLQITS
jgi:hypothetical protein